MKVLVFGGTTEGRRLAAALTDAGIETLLSVATEYGKEVVQSGRGAETDIESAGQNGSEEDVKNCKVTVNRLGEKEIIDLLERDGFDCVVDATHPYAAVATENIRNACVTAGVKYYRLWRPESDPVSGVIYTKDAESAAEILKGSEGIVLLTIGSKDLEPFTRVPGYEDRFFIRILPLPGSLTKAYDLGFRGSNIICLQGPFGFEMNLAMLKMTGAEYLVTKDSGEAGGFSEKINAALSVGCKVIVIGRPSEEEGYSFSEILKFFGIEKAEDDDIEESASKDQAESASDDIKESMNIVFKEPVIEPEDTAGQKTLFPVFMDLKGKDVLVLGGGKVAERRVKTLSDFGAKITVISPEAAEFIKLTATENKIKWLKKEYQIGDITESKPFLVIAATNDRQANHSAMDEATALGIPVSVADRREECTFWFPAVAESAGFTCGIVSKDGDHTAVKEKAAEIRRVLNT